MSNTDPNINQPAFLQIEELKPDPLTGEIPATIPATGKLTPPQIANAYGIPYSDGAGIKIGIVSFGGGILQGDINLDFADLLAAGLIPSGTATPTINKVLLDGQSGAFNTFHPFNTENAVDVYCSSTVVPAATITIYFGNSYESIFTQMLADGVDIISISYTSTESDTLEPWFTTFAENKIAVCVASGDYGSARVNRSTSLSVGSPGSSPQVISVGGTKLTLNTNGTIASETDDNRDTDFPRGWGGGGGLSQFFRAPRWQSGLNYTPIVNNIIGSPTPLSMRGIPDISAPMNSYAFYYGGRTTSAGGTSLSAPVMAGILARMQKLTGVKRSSVEYNEIFYSHPEIFRDITVGTNNSLIQDGYAGTTGWDAVTGFGPPIGSALLYWLTPKYAITPASLFVNEGSSLAFNVSTVYVSDSTTLYWTISNTTTSNADFSSASGSFTINSDTGSFNVSAVADLLTEGAETFTVSIRTGSIAGPVVAVSSVVTINDTSLTPPPIYGITPSASSVNEGAILVINATTSYVNNGTILYWTINHVTTSNADFENTSGSFTINSNAGTFGIFTVADLLTEGAETFTVSIRTGSISGPVVATSSIITVNDTSQPPYTLLTSVNTINEGSSVVFTIITYGIDDGTTLYWQTSGTTLGNRFSDGVTSGSITVNNNRAFVIRTLLVNHITDGPTSFVFHLYSDQVGGNTVASSNSILVNDSVDNVPLNIVVDFLGKTKFIGTLSELKPAAISFVNP